MAWFKRFYDPIILERRRAGQHNGEALQPLKKFDHGQLFASKRHGINPRSLSARSRPDILPA
jgi:hypothetical protein